MVNVTGAITYFHNGHVDVVILIVLATISLILSLIKKFAGLWVTGLASLGVVLIDFGIEFPEIKEQMGKELSGDYLGGIINIVLRYFQLQWGWMILIVGSALIITAALKEKATGDD